MAEVALMRRVVEVTKNIVYLYPSRGAAAGIDNLSDRLKELDDFVRSKQKKQEERGGRKCRIG